MKKRKERLIRTTGFITLLVMMALNFLHAFNDYGILTNSMAAPILGQFFSGSNSSSSSTSTSSGGKKESCKQDQSSNQVKVDQCNANDRNSSCNYTVTTYSCKEGSGYACKEGSIYSGYDCNTNYNSSNCGTTTEKKCN